VADERGGYKSLTTVATSRIDCSLRCTERQDKNGWIAVVLRGCTMNACSIVMIGCVGLGITPPQTAGPTRSRLSMNESSWTYRQKPPALNAAFETGIFANLLAMYRPVPSRIVVRATPLPVRCLSDRLWASFGADAERLKAVLDPACTTATREAGLVPFTAQSFPAPVEVVSEGELDRARDTADTMTWWTQFAAKYGVREFSAFSHPVVSDDGFDALLYRAQFCGDLCGRTDLYWLHRDSATDSWALVKDVLISVS